MAELSIREFEGLVWEDKDSPDGVRRGPSFGRVVDELGSRAAGVLVGYAAYGILGDPKRVLRAVQNLGAQEPPVPALREFAVGALTVPALYEATLGGAEV